MRSIAARVLGSIAATHVSGVLHGKTDWDGIICLYDQILSDHPSAVVELNRAVAVSMRDGLVAGLDIVHRLLEGDELREYSLAYATRGDFCRRLQRFKDAQEAYEQAIELTEQAAERRFLESRLREVSDLNSHARSDSCSVRSVKHNHGPGV